MKRVKFWGAIGIFILILMRPQVAVTAAQRAMAVWCASVAPALFPFLALMPLLTSEEACAAYEVMFSKWMRVLFGLPGPAAPAVVVGMIAGSPAGAIALHNITADSNIKPGEAQRIAMALAGVSPAYLIMGVGQGLYGSTSLGMKLAGIQLCIQILLLILLPHKHQETALGVLRCESRKKGNGITMAVESLVGICGYMVFFSVIAAVTASFVGEKAGSVLLLVTDLPSGLANLVNMEFTGKMILMGMAIGLGGLCIGYQNMDIHKAIGLSWKRYLKGRGAAALLFMCACVGLEDSVVKGIPDMFDNCHQNYAVGLLIAGFLVLPALFFLSNKLFLNNREVGKNRT